MIFLHIIYKNTCIRMNKPGFMCDLMVENLRVFSLDNNNNVVIYLILFLGVDD